MTRRTETTEHELATTVRALRLAYRDSPSSAFVLDREGRFLMVNATLCRFLRVAEQDMIGQPYDRSARSTDAERIRDSVRTALGGTATRYRATGTRMDGEHFLTEVTLMPIRIEGEVVALFGTSQDLSLLEAADVEAQRGADLLRLAGRIAHFGGWSVDADTRNIDLSESARLMLGITDDVDDVSIVAWERHPPEERARVSAALDRCLTEGEPFELESIMTRTDGERLVIRTIGEAERRADGTIVGARGAILDVSAAAASRERERALEARLTATLASIGDGIIFVDENDRVTYANPTAIAMSRRTAEELMGTTLWALFPDAVSAGFRDSFERARRTGERDVHRAFFAPYERWFETTSYPTGDGLAVYLRDVTDEQSAEQAAKRDADRLAYQAALLDTARDVMLVRDLDGTIRYWNRAAADLYGWTAEEAVGQRVFDLIGMDGQERADALDQLMRDGYFAGELEQRTRDGRVIIVDARWQVLRNEAGEVTGIFAVNTDITEYRRELEARHRAQRLESLGTLAGGIAHDLNNVLTPILMAVQLLAQDERNAERLELLDTVETAVKRGTEMIRQVLSFARGVDGRRIVIDAGRLLDDLVVLTRDVMPRGVEVVVERATPLPTVVGDPTQLLQVLVNLVTNARDALGGSGRLVISADSLEIADEYTSVSHAAAPGSYLQLCVEDTGQGMPAEVVSKIFEPFFTTKVQGRGTGLGLSTSLAIVRSHGGFMQVYSEPGRGTRFTIGIPVAASADVEAPVTTSSGALPRGNGEVVLVVDDEEAIRSVTRRTLEAHGYRVLVAGDGREAIEVIEHGDEPIDLVLTDMMMPVMDGAATSAYLEEHHPDLPIIAASGLNAGGDSTAVGMGIARFIAKPYTTVALLTSVSDTLREHRAASEGEA